MNCRFILKTLLISCLKLYIFLGKKNDFIQYSDKVSQISVARPEAEPPAVLLSKIVPISKDTITDTIVAPTKGSPRKRKTNSQKHFSHEDNHPEGYNGSDTF